MGGSNRRPGGQPTPKYPKNRKKHWILATSFSNLGGVEPPGFQKCGGQDPPTPPSATPLALRGCFSPFSRVALLTPGWHGGPAAQPVGVVRLVIYRSIFVPYCFFLHLCSYKWRRYRLGGPRTKRPSVSCPPLFKTFLRPHTRSQRGRRGSDDKRYFRSLFRFNDMLKTFSTRTGRGGGKICPSLSFSRIAEKRRRATPPFFQYLLAIKLDTLCKKFQPQVTKGQVTRSGQSQKRVPEFEAAQWPH